MKKQITSQEAIAVFSRAYEEGWGYIWGGKGQTWTQRKQDTATNAAIKRYGKKWIGKRVVDCSGLWWLAYNTIGGYMYHGSNTMWRKYCASKGPLYEGNRTDGQPLKPGTAVFKVKDGNRYHVGCYVGNGNVIEAQSTDKGVVMTPIERWHEWGELVDMVFVDGQVEIHRTLKQGMRGPAVKEMQNLLNQHGANISADGIFGPKTKSALITFQSQYGLTVTGEYDEATDVHLKALFANNITVDAITKTGIVRLVLDKSEARNLYANLGLLLEFKGDS